MPPKLGLSLWVTDSHVQNSILRSANIWTHPSTQFFAQWIPLLTFEHRFYGVVILTIPTQRNFAFTLKNNKLLIEQSHLHSIKRLLCCTWLYKIGIRQKWRKLCCIYAFEKQTLWKKRFWYKSSICETILWKKYFLQNSPYERKLLGHLKRRAWLDD